MRLMTWILLFALSFFIALVLVLTFIQPEFKVAVGAQILTHKTQRIPVYFYVLGAFILGLAMGTVAAIYGFVRAKAGDFRKNKRIRELESELAEAQKGSGTQAGAAPAFPARADEAATGDDEDF
jgi:hypothetical protein